MSEMEMAWRRGMGLHEGGEAAMMRDPRCVFAWAIREAAGDLERAAHFVRHLPQHLRRSRWVPEDFDPLANEYRDVVTFLAHYDELVASARLIADGLDNNRASILRLRAAQKTSWKSDRRGSTEARKTADALVERVKVQEVSAAVVAASDRAKAFLHGDMIADGHIMALRALALQVWGMAHRAHIVVPGGVGGQWTQDYPARRYPRIRDHVVVSLEAVPADPRRVNVILTGPGARHADGLDGGEIVALGHAIASVTGACSALQGVTKMVAFGDLLGHVVML